MSILKFERECFSGPEPEAVSTDGDRRSTELDAEIESCSDWIGTGDVSEADGSEHSNTNDGVVTEELFVLLSELLLFTTVGGCWVVEVALDAKLVKLPASDDVNCQLIAVGQLAIPLLVTCEEW